MLLPGRRVRLLHLKLLHDLLPVIRPLYLEPLHEKLLTDIETEIIERGEKVISFTGVLASIV